MPDIRELGRMVKRKYPGAYDDQDDAALGAAVQKKYPGAYDDYTAGPAVTGPVPGAPTKTSDVGAGPPASSGLFKIPEKPQPSTMQQNLGRAGQAIGQVAQHAGQAIMRGIQRGGQELYGTVAGVGQMMSGANTGEGNVIQPVGRALFSFGTKMEQAAALSPEQQAQERQAGIPERVLESAAAAPVGVAKFAAGVPAAMGLTYAEAQRHGGPVEGAKQALLAGGQAAAMGALGRFGPVKSAVGGAALGGGVAAATGGDVPTAAITGGAFGALAGGGHGETPEILAARKVQEQAAQETAARQQDQAVSPEALKSKSDGLVKLADEHYTQSADAMMKGDREKAAELHKSAEASMKIAKSLRARSEGKLLEGTEPPAGGPLVGPVKEPLTQPTPSKPLYDMNQEELSAHHQSLKEYEKAADVEVLGEEGAREYNRLQRTANKTPYTKEEQATTDAASEKIRAIEDALTPHQQNRLFGIGETGPSAEEAKDFVDALNTVSVQSENAITLGNSIRFAITKVGEKTDPAQMNHQEQVAYAQIRFALSLAKEGGFDPAKVFSTAIKGAASRWSDPEDAAFMLRRFLSPSATSNQEPRALVSATADAAAPVSDERGFVKIPGAEDLHAVKDKLDALYTASLDRFHPLKKLAGKAGESESESMKDDLAGYYGSGGMAEFHVDHELAPILREQPIDDLRKAAIANRDLELAGRGIKGSGEGVMPDQLRSTWGQEKYNNVQATLNKLYDWRNALMKKYMVDTGIISEKAFATMLKDNQKYVPFRRLVDESEPAYTQPTAPGSVGSQNIVQKIKGSDLSVKDPLESLLTDAYRIVGRGTRQMVAKNIAGLSDKLPDLVYKLPPGSKIDPRHSVQVMENGQAQAYAVPEDVATAARGLDEDQMNMLVKILSVPTRAFRLSATGINPEFFGPNVVRDLQTAFFNEGLNPLKWAEGLAHTIKQDAVYQDFLKAGGKTSRMALDAPVMKKKLAEVAGTERGLKVESAGDVWRILGELPARAYHGLERLGELSEQPTRVALFQKGRAQALEQGAQPQVAERQGARYAQEGTVNFSQRGSGTKSLNAVYAFLNARAQGTLQNIKTIKDHPGQASLRAGLSIAAPAIAAYAWNRQFKSYTDERVITPQTRKNNFILMLSDKPIKSLGGAQYLKIPKGELGQLANPVEEFMRYADGKGGKVGEALGQALAAFSPLNNAGDVVPTAVKPIAENYINKNFFSGRDIVPEGLRHAAPRKQDRPDVANVYRMIGDKANVSPAQIQNLAQGYGSGLERIFELSTNPLTPKKYQSPRNAENAPINQAPVVRRFMGGRLPELKSKEREREKMLRKLGVPGVPKMKLKAAP